jgi:regulator of sigma E protease
MPDFVVNIAAVVVVLGLMVLIHEWGHFVAAKLFGVRVDVFSLGFGPRLWGVKRGPTDYRVSALPLGGYVKMAGDNPTEDRAGAPDEFLSKPRWQRAVIALAGPSMNLVMAVVLTAGVFMVGMPQPVYLDQPAEIGGVLKDSPAQQAGIRAGDRIARFNQVADPKWENVLFEVLLASGGTRFDIVLDRGGEEVPLTIEVPKSRSPRDEFSLVGFPAEPVIVGWVSAGMPAERSGLQPDDRILSIDGQPVTSPVQFAEKIQEAGGKMVSLEIERRENIHRLDVRPVHVDSGDGNPRWQIGISFRSASVYRSHGLVEATGRAFWFNVRLTRQIVLVVAQLFQGKVSLKQLEGPVGIARHSGQAARRGLMELVNLMAIISLNLGILNLLPIPILDGGHLLVLGIEGVIRRDLSIAVKERFVQVGLVFLLVIFAIVMYNDILKVLPGR